MRVFPLLLLISAIGCSDPTPKPPLAAGTTVPVGGGGGGSGVTDAGIEDDGGLDSGDPDAAPDATAFRCLEGTYALDLTAPFGGTLAIAGTVRAAAPIQPGRLVVATLFSATGGSSTSGQFTVAAATQTITYRIGGLVNDSYVIRFQIDQAGSAAVGEQGDLEGYYDGVETAPILTRVDAALIPLGGKCLGNIDFGVGIRL